MELKQGKTKLNSIAYEYIKKKIIMQEMKAGTPIVESALADELGISRTPVREALNRLEEDGLVYSVPNTGTFVEHLTMKDVEEMTELRILLEVAALRHCIEGDVAAEELDQCEQTTLSICETNSQEELHEKDRALHDLIARHCPNKRLVEFLDVIKLQQDRLRYTYPFDAKRRNRMKRQHLQLIGLIRQKDFRKAAKAMEKHQSGFRGLMEKRMNP